jgi:hypothetical protein
LGILEKIEYSEWAAPIVPVLKSDGSVRICGDFKVTINPHLEVPEYPFQKPEEVFSKLNWGKKFTKLDLSNTYNQILLDEKSQEYLVINTHQGLYKFKRLPNGVASGPAILQETMDKILAGVPNVGCIMDDMIITGEADQEHLATLDKVLSRLDSHGMTLNKQKCEFFLPSVTYFGWLVDEQGRKPSPTKEEAIRKAPEPTTRLQLQSFLGLINYYRPSIVDMSMVAGPLNKLLSPGVKFVWTKECSAAFEELKKILLSSDVLVHYDVTKPVTLAVDASPYGIGAVISHVLEDGTE